MTQLQPVRKVGVLNYDSLFAVAQNFVPFQVLVDRYGDLLCMFFHGYSTSIFTNMSRHGRRPMWKQVLQKSIVGRVSPNATALGSNTPLVLQQPQHSLAFCYETLVVFQKNTQVWWTTRKPLEGNGRFQVRLPTGWIWWWSRIDSLGPDTQSMFLIGRRRRSMPKVLDSQRVACFPPAIPGLPEGRQVKKHRTHVQEDHLVLWS